MGVGIAISGSLLQMPSAGVSAGSSLLLMAPALNMLAPSLKGGPFEKQPDFFVRTSPLVLSQRNIPVDRRLRARAMPLSQPLSIEGVGLPHFPTHILETSSASPLVRGARLAFVGATRIDDVPHWREQSVDALFLQNRYQPPSSKALEALRAQGLTAGELLRLSPRDLMKQYQLSASDVDTLEVALAEFGLLLAENPAPPSGSISNLMHHIYVTRPVNRSLIKALRSAGYTTLERLSNATVDEISSVRGVGFDPRTTESIESALREASGGGLRQPYPQELEALPLTEVHVREALRSYGEGSKEWSEVPPFLRDFRCSMVKELTERAEAPLSREAAQQRAEMLTTYLSRQQCDGWGSLMTIVRQRAAGDADRELHMQLPHLMDAYARIYASARNWAVNVRRVLRAGGVDHVYTDDEVLAPQVELRSLSVEHVKHLHKRMNEHDAFLIDQALKLHGERLGNDDLRLRTPMEHYYSTLDPKRLEVPESERGVGYFTVPEGVPALREVHPREWGPDISGDLVPILPSTSPLKMLPAELRRALWEGNGAGPNVPFDWLQDPALSILGDIDRNGQPVRVSVQVISAPNVDEHPRAAQLIADIQRDGFITFSHGKKLWDALPAGLHDQLIFRLNDFPDVDQAQFEFVPIKNPKYHGNITRDKHVNTPGVEVMYDARWQVDRWITSNVRPETSPVIIVALPGVGGVWSNGGSMAQYLRYLGDRGVYAESISLPFNGLGPRDPSMLSMENVTEWLASYVQYLKTKYHRDVVVVGRSNGANMALELVDFLAKQKREDVVKGVVAISGTTADWYDYNMKAFADMVREGHTYLSPLHLWWGARVERTGAGFSHYQRAHTDWSPAALGGAQILYLCGTEDLEYPEGNERYWWDLAARSQQSAMIFGGAGHNVFEQHAEKEGDAPAERAQKQMLNAIAIAAMDGSLHFALQAADGKVLPETVFVPADIHAVSGKLFSHDRDRRPSPTRHFHTLPRIMP